MDDKHSDEYGGFSLPLILLSNALPAELYYPGEEGRPLADRDDHPTPPPPPRPRP